MKLNPADLLNPIFNFLDALIQEYGVYLYLILVWLSMMAIVRVLSGGLRRKHSPESYSTIVSGIVITVQPQTYSPMPPIIGIEIDQAQNRDDEMMD